MVPNWTLPNAIALGNCMIMKPSEKVPLSCGRLAQLLKEAGLPDGVFNVVNGDSEIVEAICDHPGIEAVSFVGSTKVAKIVYQRSTQKFKRCLALCGAKSRYDGTERCRQHEWLCRSALHGCIGNGRCGKC
jgi:malonate-semialdehyde dehydrogenase (acetylating)/methylmalonate-semialdehyde dehydrogenase